MSTLNGRSSGIVTALIYTRVSTEEQAAKGLSLDAQVTEGRHYAARQGWMLGEEYTDIMSGRKDDRPAYQQLLADVRRLQSEGRAVVVVVAALDRLGRRLLERVRCREELKRLGVSTHSVREGGEVSDIVANVLAAVAQEEVRRLGERVRASYAHIRSNGWKKPGRAALGYCWRPATEDERRRGAPQSVLEVDSEQAPIAREMFARVARGESVRAVSRWLSSLPEEVRGGRACSLMAIRRLLSARTYIAQHEDGSSGNWPALIGAETYEQVQQRIAEHRRLPRQASKRYLLTGLLRCPSCGSRMSGCARSRSRGFSRYECHSFWLGGSFTQAMCRYSVSAPRADATVIEEVGDLVEKLTSDSTEVWRALERAWQRRNVPEDDTAPLIRANEQAAVRARERIKRLALLFADGDLDREGYELGRAQAQADLDAAASELERLQTRPSATQLPPLEYVIRKAGSWRTVLQSDQTAEKRDVVAELVEHVVPHQAGYRKVRSDITWTELGEQLRQMVATLAREQQVA